MVGNLKALGFALVAVFAMSAIAATAAQGAPQFTSSPSGAVTVHATIEQKIGEESEYFESIGRKFECEVTHFHGTVNTPASNLTVTPDYTDHTQGGNCRAGGLLTMTITENGCDYNFHSPSKDATDYTVHLEIESCNSANGIEIHIGTSCTITIPPQTATGTLTTVNTAGGHIDMSGTFDVKTILHSNSGLICQKPAGSTTEPIIKYVTNKVITFTATQGGSPASISLSGS